MNEPVIQYRHIGFRCWEATCVIGGNAHVVVAKTAMGAAHGMMDRLIRKGICKK